MEWLKKHKRWAMALAGLLVLGLGAWAFQSLAGDPQLARVKELQKQLRGEEARNLDPEQRKELWQQLREQMKELTPEQRQVLRKERQQAFAKTLNDFFALSPEEREAYLDKQIDRMEEARQRWQARNADDSTQGASSAGRGPWGGGGPWGGKGGKGAWGGKKGGDGTTAADSTSDSSTGSGATEAKAKGWSSDPQTREQWRKQWLEQTTPEQRAQVSEYFRMLRERRKERGLPTFGPGGR